jgi:mannose-6-phosphate isomerase-like protein (cupin superfamily)
MRPAVVRADERHFTAVDPGRVSVRVAVDRAGTGCANLEQRVIRLEPGSRHTVDHERSEEIAYVVSGYGVAVIGAEELPLEPGCGLFVPPASACTVTSSAREALVLLSVLSPQPGAASGPRAAHAAADPRFVVRTADQDVIPAGDDESRGLMDRHFTVLIDPASGARYVTQFVGVIERSRAPFHTHTYEEVIYIVGGQGVVHLPDGQQEVGPGTSIYLPAGAEHSLENREDQPLTLVGVFCPAGSPAARRPATSAG